MESTDFSYRLRELEFADTFRKSLVNLAILRAHTLSSEKKVPDIEPKTEVAGDHDLEKKVLDYERKLSTLKSQLSTKDQVHEAKIDGFKQLITRLQSQLQEQSRVEPTRKGKRTTLSSPAGKFGNSSFLSPARTSSVFNFPSPFGDKSGKGNSFTVSGINSSIASQASLRLSKGKASEDVFSPNNSSAETTPKKAKGGKETNLGETRSSSFNRELMRIQENGPDSPKNVSKADIRAESSSLDLSAEPTNSEEPKDGSGPDDTFQSANSTFKDAEGSRKSGKKKRIRLFSSEASKILVESQSKLNDEEKDPNHLDYYEDENFKDDLVSPTRPFKRGLSEERSEKPVKKRHVFKI